MICIIADAAEEMIAALINNRGLCSRCKFRLRARVQRSLTPANVIDLQLA